MMCVSLDDMHYTVYTAIQVDVSPFILVLIHTSQLLKGYNVDIVYKCSMYIKLMEGLCVRRF